MIEHFTEMGRREGMYRIKSQRKNLLFISVETESKEAYMLLPSFDNKISKGGIPLKDDREI